MESTAIGVGRPEIKAILEGLLLVATKPLGLKELTGLLPEFSKDDILIALKLLQREYDDQCHGLEIREVAGGWRLQSKSKVREWILRLKESTPAKLGRSSLETLSIIAYKQPVTRAEIEHLRGVDSSGPLRILLDRKLIKTAGRKEVPGRPLIYRTTKRFLEVFDLKDISDLPSLAELSDMEDTHELPLFK
ncbi:MAG: SMC-Scp complex subunit ScpB [Dissulfurimicrobium sp.]|uniref:SMC-Scp complex subunit ScpB n=1 Tax=Dissulfurimicrobium TaxID=1769732 RepID=UPI001EDB7762|nr:SMC-Scp complex subunit ScpB [Dissulfurimicrobium hydrothermale]UKL14481.1 SMC-Scp complex subunit ScpB [Dissulfurimicrobium hydrothermale]